MAKQDVTHLIHGRLHAAQLAEYLAAAYWQRESEENYREYLVEKALEQFAELSTAIEGIKAFRSSGEPEETDDEPLDDPADHGQFGVGA